MILFSTKEKRKEAIYNLEIVKDWFQGNEPEDRTEHFCELIDTAIKELEKR